MREVAPGIHHIPIPIPYPMKYVNCYLLKGDGHALIDTGLDTPEARRALTEALAHFGLDLADLDEVLLTHHHPDHYGLAGLLEAAGARVRMLDVEYQRGHAQWTRFEAHLPQTLQAFAQHGMPEPVRAGILETMRATRRRLHPPQHPETFPDGAVLEVAGMTLQAFWTPGHADGHAVFLRPADGTLLAGDHILERITPNISLWPHSRPNPLKDYLEALERVRALAPERALVGHYGPVIPDVPRRIAEIQAHHQARLEHLKTLLARGPQTAWDLSLALFPGELTLAQRRFAWAETLAHLEYLVAVGLAARLEGRTIRYAPA
ncbi:MBL fold metallo-hydrolase [Marinithermus hydrothermalis]|uniref:Beta-lactamase domain protein n=1 Tax=Marinithermus hydrothermalis (strain DSM 14884 / JCM 11576 / T1) TaxID=869210 RepID=F2NKB8_MARHT|nr:MBL fold metallo-hydrolase [Marinithermus hydrothermalis]AEB12367.1 beta-lactamase domain protein [Marinithermus hydrothermalis DSM 14884]